MMSLALGSKHRQKEKDEYYGLSEFNLSKTTPQKPAIQNNHFSGRERIMIFKNM